MRPAGSCKEQDDYVGVSAADPEASLDAVQVGHVHVDQHELHGKRADQGEGLAP